MAGVTTLSILPKGFKTYIAQVGELKAKWFLVDASGKTLGRLAAPIAMRLMGKDKPTYTRHLDTGDFVVVINAEKIHIDARKQKNKTYQHWSGYLGGLKITSYAERQTKKPEKIIHDAVRLMLPKNLLAKQMLSKLKVYRGSAHPHSAQRPEAWDPLA